MVASPGRLPDGGARDLEPDGDLGELRTDCLMLDDAAPALHAQLRVVERRLVGGAADPEIERRRLCNAAPGIGREGVPPVRAEKIVQRHPTVPEFQLATGAVLPAHAAFAALDGQSGRVARHQQRARAAGVDAHLDREQLGERRVRHAVLAAIDYPASIRAYHGGLGPRRARSRPVVVDPERSPAVRLALGEREMMVVVGEERRQKARALLWRHGVVEQRAGEARRMRKHGRNIGIAGRDLLGDDAAGERVGARATGVLRQRERAQAKLRRLIEHVREQPPGARFEPRGRERLRLDLACDEIANRVADVALLRAEVKVVHAVTPP
jgi:hypothetical protein